MGDGAHLCALCLRQGLGVFSCRFYTLFHPPLGGEIMWPFGGVYTLDGGGSR